MDDAQQNDSKSFTTVPGDSKVALIDSVSEVDRLAAEINAVKRRRGEEGNEGQVLEGGVPLVVAPANGTVKRSDAPKVRRQRVAPKRLPLRIRKHSIWNKLEGVNAGLSPVDWLALDKNATKELQEGLRTLRSKNET